MSQPLGKKHSTNILLVNDFFDLYGKKFDFFRVLLTKNPRSKEASAIETLMRQTFGQYILMNSVKTSVEFEKASAQFGSVYELKKTNTESYNRAIKSFDSVFYEIISSFTEIWERQAAEKYSQPKKKVKAKDTI